MSRIKWINVYSSLTARVYVCVFVMWIVHAAYLLFSFFLFDAHKTNENRNPQLNFSDLDESPVLIHVFSFWPLLVIIRRQNSEV